MKLALAMGRPDVDAMLDDVDADQFAEWAAFLSIHPTGWDAVNLVTARLSLVAVQPHARQRLREADFLIRLGDAAEPRDRDAYDRARAEAAAIRQTIRARAAAI